MTKEAKKMLRTGVKHIRPTISGFTHDKPDKAESMLTRLNLRSSDPLGAGGGGGGGRPQGITGLDVSAAFAFEMVQVRSVEKYVGKAVTKSAIVDLVFYKHTGDMKSFHGIKAAAMSIMIGMAIEKGWNNHKNDDDRPRGIIEACAITVIEDVCAPSRFVGLSARRWASMLGLSGHKDWQRKWETRYGQLRDCLQQLDIAADEQIKRRV